MKINFPALFKVDVKKYKYFLIHGNDLVVFERSISFLSKKLSYPLEVKSEKDFLENSVQEPSLFAPAYPQELTLVSNVSDKIIPHLTQEKEGLYIFTSEKARAQSKLVLHFASSPLTLSISAYASPLVPAEFEFLIGDLNLPPPFKGLLFKAYQNDYMGLLAALEKIKLYGEVPEEAHGSFLESSCGPDDLQGLLQPFLLKNKTKALEVLSTLNPAEMIPFLRALLRSFQTLYELLPFKRNPQAIEWQKLLSPVFFKDQPLFQSALSLWNGEDVLQFLETLLGLEYKVKYEKLLLSQASQELTRGL